MKNKKTLGIILVVVLLVAALLAVYFLTRPAASAGQKAFTVEVTHSDGTQKTFTYKSDEEFLGPVLQEEGLISGVMEAYGLYIHVVDGEKAVYEEDDAYWGFYVNGEYAPLGIDKTPIDDGAVYQLTYTGADEF